MDVQPSQCDHSVKGMEQRMCNHLYVVHVSDPLAEACVQQMTQTRGEESPASWLSLH